MADFCLENKACSQANLFLAHGSDGIAGLWTEGLWAVGRIRPHGVEGSALELPELEIPGLLLCVHLHVPLLNRAMAPSQGCWPQPWQPALLEVQNGVPKHPHRLSVDLPQQASRQHYSC